jgi:nitrite reductase (NADH) small subunit
VSIVDLERGTRERDAPESDISERAAGTWVDVCAIDELERDRGACALVESRQIALFRVSPGDEVFAISNYDPCGGACVLSRGIVGSVLDTVFVASPLYKHRFDLRSGACLDDPTSAVPVYRVRVDAGRVLVAVP